MKNNYISGGKASKILGISQNTLRLYANEGKIKYILTAGKQRRYNIDDFIINNKIFNRKNICYCRVSTHGQKDDLVRQVEYMKHKYPKYEIITDVGSGINFQRPGLIKIIDYAINNEIENLVIAYKDRLCRIGYELIEYILLTFSLCKITVENHDEETINEIMAKDILQVITVYSAKLNGMRSYKLEKK